MHHGHRSPASVCCIKHGDAGIQVEWAGPGLLSCAQCDLC